MDVAITGASGLIGTALQEQLRGGGHRVVRVVRGGGGPDTIRWNPAAATIDAGGFEGLDAVVHLAGEGIASKRWSAEQRQRIERSRVDGTALLADALAGLRNPPAVLLSGSAVGYYGERGDQVLTEESSAGDTFLARLCVAWEAATSSAADAGVRVAHLRTGIVLDRHGGALAKMSLLFKLGFGGRLGSGRQYWPWISLTDVVGALCWLLQHDVKGPVNLTGPEPVTNREFTAALASAVHRPALIPVPAFGPRLLLGRELADALLFTSARVLPEALQRSGYPFCHPTVGAALDAIFARPSRETDVT